VRATLLRIAIVGGISFIVDAGILTVLVTGFSWHHYAARAISFTCAVTLAWLLNRRFTFRRTDDARREYSRYFTIQIIGAAINLGTYVIVIEVWPGLAAIPVIPLAIGAGLALGFNFIAARTYVFAADIRPASGNTTLESSYSGRENLEAMKHAQNYNRYLIGQILQHARDGQVLDFGAGAGTFAKPLTDAGLSVACVEPDAGLRATLAEQGLPAYGDLEQVASGTVDYIYTLNVLEHIDDDAGAVSALAERLKPSGRLFIYVPAFACLYSSMDRNVGHFRRYRLQSLRSLLERAGLTVDTARYVDSAGFFASLIYKAFGDDSGEISPRSVALYDRFAFPLSRLADLVLHRVLGKNLLIVATKA